MNDLEDLYRERRTDLVRAAVLLLDDRAAAEEVVQDAFVSLYRAFPRLRDRSTAGGYLYRTVVNNCRSHLRRQASVRRRPFSVVEDAPGADRAVLASERKEAVVAALAALPQRQRECAVLRWYLDLPEREIAESLGISAGSVKTHLHRGRAALAEALEVLR